jgi:hypothetical protein
VLTASPGRSWRPAPPVSAALDDPDGAGCGRHTPTHAIVVYGTVIMNVQLMSGGTMGVPKSI